MTECTLNEREDAGWRMQLGVDGAGRKQVGEGRAREDGVCERMGSALGMGE